MSRRFIAGLVLLMATCLLSGCQSESLSGARDFYVATYGDDRNPGTEDEPFASLDHARDELRKRRIAGKLGPGPVNVWIRKGTYSRTSTFLLTADDSGTEQSPVCYRAFGDEEVIITGGTDIPEFSPIADPAIASRFDSTARNAIVQIDLSLLGRFDFDQLTKRFATLTTDIQPTGAELFYNNIPMTLARWPNNGWTTIIALPTGNLSGRITYEGDRPRNWSRIEDIVLYGFWAYDWFANYEKVVSIDTAKHEIQTGYVPPPNPYGFRVGQRYKAINILEELDEPGEWYLDRQSGILYFWPPADHLNAKASLSLLETPLVKLEQVSFVTFRNLIFQDTRGCGIEMVGGNHNLVAGCTLRNIGTVGVAIGGMIPDILWQTNFNTTFKGRGGIANGVTSCNIYNTGMGGVLLGGGDRLTLESGGNYAINNNIYAYSRLARTDRPAIYMYGVGNVVSHNLLHDGPDLALAFWGNDHLIEYNEIYRVGQEIDDGGAMKIGRDFSQRGTVIRYNYFHDLVGSVNGSHIGVYLDDFQSGITIFGNIFYKVNLGVNVGGGRDNAIENNIFVHCSKSVHVDARGLTWASYFFNGQNTTLWDRLAAVNYTAPPYSVRYPELSILLMDEPAVPKGNRIIRNIITLSMPPTLIEGAEKVVHLENNLIDDAPGFVSVDLPDLRLNDDSLAWGMGFSRIPTEKIGLYKDEYRKNLAVIR